VRERNRWGSEGSGGGGVARTRESTSGCTAGPTLYNHILCEVPPKDRETREREREEEETDAQASRMA